MARTVIWTEAALQDLDDIAEFIARDSKLYAKAFVKEARQGRPISQALSRKRTNSSRLGESELRELFIRRYRLTTRLKAPTEST
jgi:plasmid stabilization system protein ParE